MRHPMPAAVSAALSAAGLGLLLWLGLSVALIAQTANMSALRAVQLWSLLFAFALLASAIGISALAPTPAGGLRTLWRAPTRWHARRNAMVLSSVVLACAVGTMLAWVPPGASRAALLGLCGLLLAMSALAAVAAGAMVHASDPGSPVVLRHPLTVPIRLLSAMQIGLALTFALMAGLLPAGREAGSMLAILLVLGLLLVIANVLYWRDTPGDKSHTRLQLGACALFAGVPLLAAALGFAGIGGAVWWLWIIAMAVIAGTVVERWLFLDPPAYQPIKAA